MKRCLIHFVLSIILLGSCNKLVIRPNIKNTPQNCFNQIWEDLNNKYVFFDVKSIKWDSIKTVYQSKINDNMNEAELFTNLSQMLGSLKDGHTSLYTPLDTFKFEYYYGANQNFNESFVNQKYLMPNNYATTETIKHCIFNNNIGYMYYSSFKGDLTLNKVNTIIESFASTKGLIIDLRNNSGGSNDNIYRLMEHFVQSKFLAGYYYQKTGSKANQISSPFSIYIEPRGTLYSKPIVILSNRKIYSSANIFLGFMSQLTNVKIIGDISRGGSGIPTSNQLPNGWLYRFSSSYIVLANQSHIENGITPTINLGTGSAEELLGKDTLIEKAILELQ